MMWFEKEVNGPRKKGTFLPHVVRYVGLSIGSSSLEQVQDYLKKAYCLKDGSESVYDPKGYINSFIREFKHQIDIVEDISRNCLTPQDVMQRGKKWKILKKLEEDRKNKGKPHFHHDKTHEILRMELFLKDFENLYGETTSSVSQEVKPNPPKRHIKLIIHDSYLENASNSPPLNRQKQDETVTIVPYDDSEGEGDTKEAASALKALGKGEEVDGSPGSPSLFQDEVYGYKAHLLEGEESIDFMHEREAISSRYVEDEDFIKTQEFKDFWIQMKMKYFKEKR